MEALEEPSNGVARLGRISNRLIEAFGEQKTVREWARDSRCKVTQAMLEHRIKRGGRLEESLGPELGRQRNAAPVTAFGESKPVTAWLSDPRCRVREDVLRARLREGEPAEEAITKPYSYHYITAFGETKSLHAWIQDWRCNVSAEMLGSRIGNGFPPEMAMDPSYRRPKANLVEAFGRGRTLGEWAKGPRCRVSAAVLYRRVRNGMPIEMALTTRNELRLVFAFGEYKLVHQWAADERAAVGAETIRKRLNAGFPPEQAITEAPRKWKRDGRFEGPQKPERGVLITAFDETRSIAGWARNWRCSVRAETIRSRLRRGWTPRTAIATPPGKEDLLVPPPKHSKPRRGMASAVIEAFGERKHAWEWAQDPRCLVNETEMLRRLGRGWPLERAMGEKRARPNVELRCEQALERASRHAKIVRFAGLGEEKSCPEWAKDPRCQVSLAELYRRLTAGVPVEEALKCRRKPAEIEAFGETKTVEAWVRDPRAKVLRQAIEKRLRKGWTAEDAISLPAPIVGQLPRGCTRGPFNAIFVEAFGETKSIADWARDPRATVCDETIRCRLFDGIQPEHAITLAPLRETVSPLWKADWR